MFVCVSTDGVFQTVAPPVENPSGPAAQVWPPISPGAGAVKKRNAGLPSLAW